MKWDARVLVAVISIGLLSAVFALSGSNDSPVAIADQPGEVAAATHDLTVSEAEPEATIETVTETPASNDDNSMIQVEAPDYCEQNIEESSSADETSTQSSTSIDINCESQTEVGSDATTSDTSIEVTTSTSQSSSTGSGEGGSASNSNSTDITIIQ